MKNRTFVLKIRGQMEHFETGSDVQPTTAENTNFDLLSKTHHGVQFV
jgi:hypothetical protein